MQSFFFSEHTAHTVTSLF